MSNESPIWQPRDTVIVALAFSLPLLSGLLALSTYNEITLGNVSVIEFDWTFWAVIGILVATYKLYLLGGDQAALSELRRGSREWLGGLWGLANVIGFDFIFLTWVVAGAVAMQFPTNPIPRVAGIPPQMLTGGAFILGEAVLLGIMVFGLRCRQLLDRRNS